MIGREKTRDLIQQVADRSGLGLTVGETWLMGRMRRGETLDPAVLAERYSVDPGRLATARQGLIDKGLVTAGDDGEKLTGEGRTELVRLGEARLEVLEGLVDDWSPEADEALAPVLSRLSDELAATEVSLKA